MKLLKLLGWLAAALLVLIVLAALLLPRFFDSGEFRDRVAREFEAGTGRTLSLDEDLKLKVFPWLGVELGRTRIGNAEGFGDDPFAVIDEAAVGVRLMPLLSREIEVSKVRLSGLKVNLHRKKDGSTNWDDLAGGDAADPAPATEGQAAFDPSSVRIAGVEITDAEVVLVDDLAGQRQALALPRLSTGPIALGQPFDIDAELRAAIDAPPSALQARVSLNLAVDAAMTAIAIRDLKVAGTLEGETLPGGSQDVDVQAPAVTLDLDGQTLSLPELTVRVLGLQADLSAEGQRIVDDPEIAGTLVIEPFSPRELMLAMATEVPVTADEAVLGLLEARAGFRYAGDTAELTNLEGRLDDSRFDGQASVGLSETTLVRARLNIDAIDVDRYLPPAGEAAADAGEETAPSTDFQLDALQGLDVEAGLTIGQVTVMGMKITDTKADLTLKDSRLELNPVAAAMYGGGTTMSMVLNGRQSPATFRLEQRLDGVNLKPLLSDFADTDQVSGTAVSRMKVSSRGNSADALIADLDGTMSFAVEDARLEGINLWYEISRAYALIKQKPAPEKTGTDTVFKDFKGSANIQNGVARTDDLEAGTPFLSLTGKGKMSLVDSTLDYKLAATVLSTATDPETGEVSDIAGRSIPIRVTGTLDNPKVLPDMEAIVKSEAEDLIKDQLNLDEDKSLQESLEEKAMDELKKLFD